MRIVMDDAGDIAAHLIEKYNIHIVPINIAFGTSEYLSGIDMDDEAFYAKVKTVSSHNFPKTSQPTPFQMAEAYRALIEQGETEILTVTVGQKLSGTYASAIAAAKELEGEATFHIFDSQAASAAEGFLALAAARWAAEGKGSGEIIAGLEKMREQLATVFTIDSLEFAVKGGRVSSLKSMMASLLSIKPILELEDGVVAEAGRVRTRKRALKEIVQRVVQQVGDKRVRVAVVHAQADDEAAALLEQAKDTLNYEEAFAMNMSISVAVNLGPGALGLIVVPAD
ncbi:MAG TPA: DegV family protein [Anaerolineae bacterium]|nr:DegV family protein [Anaerolineae bacterium]